MQVPVIPFKILVFGPFLPGMDNLWSHGPIRVDKTNLNEILKEFGLTLNIPIPKGLYPPGQLTVSINQFKDFHPDLLIENTPVLKNLWGARRFLEEAKQKGLSEEEISLRLKEWPDLPSQIRFEPRKPRSESRSPVDDILSMVALPAQTPEGSGNGRSFITQIDSHLRQILIHLFSYQPLRDLESVWQGLQFLIGQTGRDGEITLNIFPASFETLGETLSELTIHLIEDPPNLVILDLPFDNSPRSMDLLEQIAQFAETFMAPALFYITSRFFYLDHWDEMSKLPFLPHYLEEPAFAKWRSLGKAPSARWIAASCNRFLIRYPFGPDNKPRLIQFDEPHPLWVSPVWAIGSLISQSLVKDGWPTRFTGWQEFRLENLALFTQREKRQIPTEVSFGDERIDQLIKAGILPLVSMPNKDYAFLPAETTVARSSLAYQLFLSRITQFIFWCQDNLDPVDLEENLRKALVLYWERSGHPAPRDLEISVSRTDPQGSALVRLAISPSRQILPSGERIEMEFKW
jgi:type VI secretion system protein ImpC